MQTEWEPAHCETLRKLLASSLSTSEIAAALNAIYRTGYSRSAVIGRARRMGLAGMRPEDRPKPSAAVGPPSLQPPREHRGVRLRPPILEAAEPVKLRCADIDPRHLSLTELEAGDCRYPYGGDEEGEPITFCGHPRREKSSYCAAHLELVRDVEAALEAGAGETVRRLHRSQDRPKKAAATPTMLPRRDCRENVISLLNFKLAHRE